VNLNSESILTYKELIQFLDKKVYYLKFT